MSAPTDARVDFAELRDRTRRLLDNVYYYDTPYDPRNDARWVRDTLDALAQLDALTPAPSEVKEAIRWAEEQLASWAKLDARDIPGPYEAFGTSPRHLRTLLSLARAALNEEG